MGVLIGAVSLILYLRRGSGSASAAPTVVQVPSQTADTGGSAITAAPLDLSSGGDLSNLLAALLGNSGSGAGTGSGTGAATVVQPPSGYNYGVSSDSPPPSSQLPPVTAPANAPDLSNQVAAASVPAKLNPITGRNAAAAAALASQETPATVSAAGGGPSYFTTSDPRPGPGAVSPGRGVAARSTDVPPAYNPQVPTQTYDAAPVTAPAAAPAAGGLSGGTVPSSPSRSGTDTAGGAGGAVTAPRPSAPDTSAPSGLSGGTVPSSPSRSGTDTAPAPPRSAASHVIAGLMGTGAAA